MGPSPCGSNTRFRHLCWIRILAQCPDTWDRVHSVQIPDSDIFAGLELWHSVRTHGTESMWLSNTRFRHFCWIRILAQCPDTWDRVHSVQIPDSDIFAGLEFLHSVQTHEAESMWLSNTRFRHFCWIRILAQCPDTWDRVHSLQIPDSDIFAGLEFLHSVQTHGTESTRFKYPIPTFLLD